MLLGLSSLVVLFKLLTALLKLLTVLMQVLLILHKLSMLLSDACLLENKLALLHIQSFTLSLDFLFQRFQILSFIHLHVLLLVDWWLSRVRWWVECRTMLLPIHKPVVMHQKWILTSLSCCCDTRFQACLRCRCN